MELASDVYEMKSPTRIFTAALVILMTREKNVYCGDSLMQRHEDLFTVTDLKQAENSKRLGKDYLTDNMQYIGTNESCRPYIDLLASRQLTRVQ